MEERIKQFACSGWNEDSSRNEFLKAKQLDRRNLLFGEKKSRKKSISAWSTKWDPRTPPKERVRLYTNLRIFFNLTQSVQKFFQKVKKHDRDNKANSAQEIH